MEDNGELQELHKLSPIESEETLDDMLCTLCSTTKTGLSLSDNSHFQSLLHLSSPSQLHPVLACLRSLARKCAHHNLARRDILKLFPPDLPLHLQTNLLSALQKNRDRWKNDVSPQLAVRDGAGGGAASSLLWPRPQQEDDSLVPELNRTDFETAPIPCFRCDSVTGSDHLENLPCLKSITWTMENRGSSPADRVAIVSLKLHDYSKSPSGESEVKFRLNRNTLEAMLRSMTYISEQLSAVGTSSGPANKKQKQ